jgi:flavin-binding protein dodecin
MPEKTYKIIEVVGVPGESIHLAVRKALTKASQTVHGSLSFLFLLHRPSFDNPC